MAGQGSSAHVGSGGLGKKLLSFAVYADSHLNQNETESMSPHEVNKLANGRHRYVIEQINRIAPTFAIHLGDLVHPVPVMGIYADAAERFREQIAELDCPLHLIPGNHDVGDKPIRWGPAEPVSEQGLAQWEKHFGPHYCAFEHEGCRMILLNAQIINSGFAAEGEQRAWLEAELEAHRAKRLFVALHYPPFIYREDELEYYDNLAEPGRSWLVGLLRKYGVEAVFAGHVHNFWYNRIGDTAVYILPSITFVRHDYSEMYRVPAGAEAGRNDAVKLGFLTVDVYEHGHLCNPVRTYGRVKGSDEAASESPLPLLHLHPRLNERGNFGFDLRQPWAEVVEIPPSGGLDEFARKIVRNDYPLLALWEMGVRKVRIPFQDLLIGRKRERMEDLRHLGMEFTIFSYQVPQGLSAALREHGDLVSAWELAVPPEEIDGTLEQLRPFRVKSDVGIYLSRLRSKEDMETDGQRYYHVINHGYVAGEKDIISKLTSLNSFREVVDGLVFRIPRERACWEEIIAIGELAHDLEINAAVHARLATSNPAAEACDDLANGNRIAEALAATLTQPHLNVYLDTFADVDRGYFVRTGVVDRRYNPRLGLNVVRHLYAWFARSGEPLSAVGRYDSAGGSIIALRQGTTIHSIVMPNHTGGELLLPDCVSSLNVSASAVRVDLSDGSVHKLPATAANSRCMLPKAGEAPFVMTFCNAVSGHSQ